MGFRGAYPIGQKLVCQATFSKDSVQRLCGDIKQFQEISTHSQAHAFTFL